MLGPILAFCLPPFCGWELKCLWFTSSETAVKWKEQCVEQTFNNIPNNNSCGFCLCLITDGLDTRHKRTPCLLNQCRDIWGWFHGAVQLTWKHDCSRIMVSLGSIPGENERNRRGVWLEQALYIKKGEKKRSCQGVEDHYVRLNRLKTPDLILQLGESH